MMNTTSSKKNAGAVGAKTARACDYCIRKRARWYCAADDAFLCQVCDGSVHSANPLARRHERVRLKTASSLKHSSSSDESSTCIIPSWHRGLKKKPRTPRHGKHHQRNRPPIVPDLGGSEDNTSHEDDSMEEEQLLYRVPTFDPFMVELLSSPTTTITSSEVAAGSANKYPTKETVRYQAESKSIQSILLNEDVHDVDSSNPCDFLPSDLDLAEFAADVETLLGKGLEEESFGIQELGLLDCHDDVDDNKKNFNSNIDMNYCSTSTITDCGSTGGIVIKTEEEEGTRRAEEEMLPMQTGCHLDMEIDMLRGEPFELTFDYEEDYPTTTCCDEEEVGNVTKAKMMMITREENGAGLKDEGGNNINNKEWKISLKLDYDAITTAWASQGTTSPWMNGQRPQINPDDSWLHSLGGTTSTSEARLLYSDLATIGTAGQVHREDGGREARVSRYKEKRRTRLFSKKIRYEVRKLNAEKRPRMKGRFVKQSSFASDQIPMFTK